MSAQVQPVWSVPAPPEPIDSLAAALVAAQLEVQNPPLDATNPHFKSKFASLPAVRNAIVPVFAKHGLAITQDLRTTERGIACTTILMHKSGQTKAYGPLEMPATKLDAQGLGSAATYARRYALLAVAGVAGEEDDDGSAATKPNGAPKMEPISDSQVADLESLIEEVGADRAAYMKHLKIASLKEIPAKNYKYAVEQLERKRK